MAGVAATGLCLTPGNPCRQIHTRPDLPDSGGGGSSAAPAQQQVGACPDGSVERIRWAGTVVVWVRSGSIV